MPQSWHSPRTTGTLRRHTAISGPGDKCRYPTDSNGMTQDRFYDGQFLFHQMKPDSTYWWKTGEDHVLLMAWHACASYSALSGWHAAAGGLGSMSLPPIVALSCCHSSADGHSGVPGTALQSWAALPPRRPSSNTARSLRVVAMLQIDYLPTIFAIPVACLNRNVTADMATFLSPAI